MTSKEIKSCKGLSLTVTSQLTLLILMGIIVLIFIIFVEHYYDVKVLVDGYDLDRKALDASQALLSSEKLVYNDGTHFYRAIFDKEKLDLVLAKGDMTKEKNLQADNKIIDIVYPKTTLFFVVKDLESTSKDVWSAKVAGPTIASGGFGSEIPDDMKSFPVAIKSGNDIHVGRMFVGMIEESIRAK